MANINSITPILKEVYTPRIVEQLDNYTVFMSRLTKSSDNISQEFGGKYVYFPIHVGRNSGIGSRLEDEVLPAAGQQKYDGGRVKLKYGYGAIRVTGPSVALSDSNPKAFAKVITEETEGLTRDLGRDFNRQLFGNGNGALGYFSAGSATATANITDSARGLGPDDYVDIYDAAGTATATGVRIVAVDYATRNITFASAQTVVANGFVTRAGSGRHAVQGNREITGLKSIISNTGVLYDIDPALQPVWKAQQLTKRANPFTIEEDMTLMTDQIFAAGGKTSLMITTQGVRRAYAKELMSLRQTVNRTEHEGGFSGLKFTSDGPSGEIEVLVDLDAPKGEIQFLDMSDLTLYRDKAWSWLDRDGSMWKQDVSGGGPKDAWRAEMTEYHELAISRRNTHGKITAITEA